MKSYSINPTRPNQFQAIYTVTLYDMSQRIVSSVTFDNFEPPEHVAQEAQLILADYMENNHAGLVRITGPGMCKVIYQEPGCDEPIESDFDDSMSVVYLD